MAVYDRWHTKKPREVRDPSGELVPVEPCREHSRGNTVLYPSTEHGKGKRWQVRWTDDEGESQRRNFEKKDGKNADLHAEAFDAQVHGDLQAGTYTDPSAGEITLKAYAQQWRSGLTADRTTLRGIDNRLAHIFDVERGPRSRRPEGSSPIGGQRMALLSKRPSMIQKWIKSLEAKGLSPGYIKLICDTLSAIFVAAVEDGIIHRNPVKASSVTRPKVAKKLIVPWTWPMVLAAAEELGEREAGIAHLGALAALRSGEIFGFAVEDVEFLGMKRMIHIRRQVRLVDNQLVFSLPKHDKERDVPLSDTLALLLSAQMKACEPVAVTLPWKHPGGKPHTAKLFFTRPDGRAWVHQSFVHWWHKARAAAGAAATPENGMHVLRHTAASAWLARGTDIRKVAAWLGHNDPGFTLRTYIHLMPDDADLGRKAMDDFAKIPGSPALDPPSERV